MTASIEKILQKMSLEEKAGLCTGASNWTTTKLEHHGIPELFVSDGPHGVRREIEAGRIDAGSIPATCFPTASCLASTWDADLIEKLGIALAEECIALEVDVLLGPGVNMKRTPLGGRNFEYFSEDPFLAGHLAASYITGVQSKGIGTSLKHFACNNQETQRMIIDAIVDERTLHEIYLPAFEIAVKKAQPWTVMCAYNRVNGDFGSENHGLLVDILKNDWLFEGFVVSDWGAVHDRVTSLRAGLDLEMPGPRNLRVQSLVEAVTAGQLPESILDDAVRRILTVIFKAAETPKGGTIDIDQHHALARQIASEGMVLLKNNGLLPLKSPQHIAIIGLAARQPYFQGEGSSHINPTRVDSPFDELQKMATHAHISFAQGYLHADQFDQNLINEAVEKAAKAEVALLYLSLPPSKESEGYDRQDLDLTIQQVALIKAVCSVQPNSVVILNNGAPLVMQDWIDAPAAILEAWMMGQAGGGAIADILFGKVNPSGRLAETFPLQLVDTPAYINFPGGHGQVRYGEGLYIGYRYYEKKHVPVQFPFGFGLSYSTYQYSNPKVSTSSFRDVEGLTFSVNITNTGIRTGKEVVQLYVHDHQSELDRPEKELKGFAKIELQPGETKTVSFSLDYRAFAYYHPSFKKWICEDGQFDLLIGSSSAEIHCCETVTLRSTEQLPSLLHSQSTLNDWLNDPRGKLILQPLLDQMIAQREEFNGDIQSSSFNFLRELHLKDLLYFQANDLPASPEEIIAALLDQVHEKYG